MTGATHVLKEEHRVIERFTAMADELARQATPNDGGGTGS